MGAITRDGRVVGQFTLAVIKTEFGFALASQPGQDRPQSEISTPSGIVRHYIRNQKVAGRTATEKFLHGDSEIAREYRIDNRVVARRTEGSVWFDENLSDDARMCIVAEMAIWILRERTARSTQDAGQLNTSVTRLLR